MYSIGNVSLGTKDTMVSDARGYNQTTPTTPTGGRSGRERWAIAMGDREHCDIGCTIGMICSPRPRTFRKSGERARRGEGDQGEARCLTSGVQMDRPM